MNKRKGFEIHKVFHVFPYIFGLASIFLLVLFIQSVKDYVYFRHFSPFKTSGIVLRHGTLYGIYAVVEINYGKKQK